MKIDIKYQTRVYIDIISSLEFSWIQRDNVNFYDRPNNFSSL